MKNFFRSPFFILLFFTANINAQVVDQSINSVQIGFLGVWWNNETKMSKNWAFRSEIGYESPFIAHETQFNSGATISNLYMPVVNFEPRWYYNSPKRQGNSTNSFHNSSDFATIAIKYYPNFLAISNHNTKKDGGLFLIPTWGIRRNISYRINYEFGIGMGFDILEIGKAEDTDLIYNLAIRIGYKYGRKAFQ